MNSTKIPILMLLLAVISPPLAGSGSASPPYPYNRANFIRQANLVAVQSGPSVAQVSEPQAVEAAEIEFAAPTATPLRKVYPATTTPFYVSMLPPAKSAQGSAAQKSAAPAATLVAGTPTPAVMTPAAAATRVPSICGDPASAPASLNPAFEQRLVELINAERAKVGKSPLKRSEDLDKAARYHANDMNKENYLAQASYDLAGAELKQVCSLGERMKNFYPATLFMMEAIQADKNMNDPQKALQAWVSDWTTYIALTAPDAWEIGVGYAKTEAREYPFWVADIGKRQGVYPLVIAGEALTTTQTSAPLFIYSDDEYGKWTAMRLRNDAGAWSAWQPFSETITWTLPITPGVHTVEVELSLTDKHEQTVVAKDTIELVGGAGSPLPVNKP